ncbi:hypothetical protein L9F63_006114, partial [Diploptera punctata]
QDGVTEAEQKITRQHHNRARSSSCAETLLAAIRYLRSNSNTIFTKTLIRKLNVHESYASKPT